MVTILMAVAVTARGPVAQASSDDYPYGSSPVCSTSGCPSDGWGYYRRECVSFVAWRFEQRGIVVVRGWGNASQWKRVATAKGYRVDATPRIGSIAWWASGHVAYVVAVPRAGTVTVEDYNWNYTHSYRPPVTISSSSIEFIHIADLNGEIPGLPPGVPEEEPAARVRADFDGDGRADVGAVYKIALGDAPGARMWLWRGTPTGLAAPVVAWEDTSFTWSAMKPV